MVSAMPSAMESGTAGSLKKAAKFAAARAREPLITVLPAHDRLGKHTELRTNKPAATQGSKASQASKTVLRGQEAPAEIQ